MTEPTKEPKLAEEITSMFDPRKDYTPDDLRLMADNMEKENIISINIRWNYDEVACFKKSMETEVEAKERYKLDLIRYKEYTSYQERIRQAKIDNLVKNAKALGFVLKEDNDTK